VPTMGGTLSFIRLRKSVSAGGAEEVRLAVARELAKELASAPPEQARELAA
jgi:hypothetical protein